MLRLLCMKLMILCLFLLCALPGGEAAVSLHKANIDLSNNAIIDIYQEDVYKRQDYQCPYCKKAYHIVKDIQKKLGDKVKFVFRNFPLTELHPHALHAAIAAEIAASHGKDVYKRQFVNCPI